MLPNFLIVGTMKSGTTSLAHNLRLHPDIFVANGELHFFNTKRYDKGLEDYASSFEEVKDELLVGEKTPSYYQLEMVRDRIYKHFPDMKLIWIFRNPVSRAYSHFRFFQWRGLEYRSFRKVVNQEFKKRPKNFTMRYVERGEYSTFVKMYLDVFPKENCLFLKYEDYKANPEKVVNEVIQFLKPGAEFFKLEQSKRVNVTRNTRFPIVNYIITKIYLKLGFGYALLRLIKGWNQKKNTPPPKMDQDIKARLKEHYIPFNKELQELTQLELSDWN